MVNNRLITITGKTKEWTEGNNGAIDMLLYRGTSVTVCWGNGKSSLVSAQANKDTWCRAEQTFCRPGKVVPYRIELFSERTDAVMEIVDVLWDAYVDSVSFHNCASLKRVKFHNVSKFDFSGARQLEYLDCDGFRGSALNLSDLTALKSLHCQSGLAELIDLSGSIHLGSLDLFGSKMRKLKINNQATLQDVSIQYCDNLNQSTRLWIEQKFKYKA